MLELEQPVKVDEKLGLLSLGCFLYLEINPKMNFFKQSFPSFRDCSLVVIRPCPAAASTPHCKYLTI